ncbi:hypothetical protein [Enterocloster asparagiformis]|uniref:hypothetical protein n=1 Tax=Enterocloster asparagiformis TaxID=333367 RepID=UPI00046641A2|nr:hypothetical protein [Enterocloster asparagiformis]
MIKVGDTVTWRSRSYRSEKRRTGKVLAIVPAGQDVDKLVPEDEPISHRNYTTVMKCDRALVEVIAGAYGGLTHYYAPKLSALERQEEEQ